MTQETLKRLFKSIEGSSNDEIVKMAYLIIEDEKKKGHINFANQLKNILESNLTSSISLNKELKKIFPDDAMVNKRFTIPLANVVERQELRHHMVLPNEIEKRFLRIEKEYVARERLAHHGLLPKKKILFYGAPGCGKSMGAERIAWNIGLPFLKVRFEAIISSYLGESFINLKKIFEGLNHNPCVLLLDEFDFIGKARTYIQDVGEMYRLVNMLLYLLEEYNAPGLLIATTNLESALDKALFRRFDEVLEIPKPGNEEIYGILKQTLASLDIPIKVNYEDIVKRIIGLSAAQVVKIAQDAAKSAILNSDVVSESHFDISINENLKF